MWASQFFEDGFFSSFEIAIELYRAFIVVVPEELHHTIQLKVFYE